MKIDLDNKEKSEILKEFVNICKTGSSKDASKFVHEAKRKGVSYEELVEYKRATEGKK